MMERYVARHEIRVLSGPSDRAKLDAALAVYVRTTSPSLRTLCAQIQSKFERPDNRFGEMFYVSLTEARQVVGFAMFGYYPAGRLVVIDHIAIHPEHRNHGSFYVFASLLQACIEERCADYDFVAAEVGIDPEFADDGTNGKALVRLLRQIGFGRVGVAYDLPGLDAKGPRKPHAGALMLRGSQKISEVRAETLLRIHHAILFEHYLPWFEDFLGDETPRYKAQLVALAGGLKDRMKGKASVAVNGFDHDELAPKRAVTSRKLLGVPRGTVGHVALFTCFLAFLGAGEALMQPDGRTFAVTFAVAAAVYLALAAQSSGNGLKVFERFGGAITRLFSGTSG